MDEDEKRADSLDVFYHQGTLYSSILLIIINWRHHNMHVPKVLGEPKSSRGWKQFGKFFPVVRSVN